MLACRGAFERGLGDRRVPTPCQSRNQANPNTAARTRLAYVSTTKAEIISVDLYRGFSVTPRTFQVRGSNRWTVEILISRRARMRAFSSKELCETEQAAVIACLKLGRRIIDRGQRDCGVDELAGE